MNRPDFERLNKLRSYDETGDFDSRVWDEWPAIRAYVEELEGQLTTVGEQLINAERVCFALDDLGIRCPFCDIGYVSLPKDHKSSCEWRRWHEARKSTERQP